jgi:hypothetical protein
MMNLHKTKLKIIFAGQASCLNPAILATQEAEIKKITL